MMELSVSGQTITAQLEAIRVPPTVARDCQFFQTGGRASCGVFEQPF